jgi:hypothetical protein
VVCTIGNGQESSYETDPRSEIIRLLRKKKSDLEAQKKMYEQQMEILSSYAKTLRGEHIKPTDVSQFLVDFADQWSENLKTVSTIAEEIVGVDRKIEKETSKTAMRKGLATGEVTVLIGADEKGSVELKLTYSMLSFSPVLYPTRVYSSSCEQCLLGAHLRASRKY